MVNNPQTLTGGNAGSHSFWKSTGLHLLVSSSSFYPFSLRWEWRGSFISGDFCDVYLTQTFIVWFHFGWASRGWFPHSATICSSLQIVTWVSKMRRAFGLWRLNLSPLHQIYKDIYIDVCKDMQMICKEYVTSGREQAVTFLSGDNLVGIISCANQG